MDFIIDSLLPIEVDPLIKDMLKMLLFLHLMLFLIFLWIIGRRVISKTDVTKDDDKKTKSR